MNNRWRRAPHFSKCSCCRNPASDESLLKYRMNSPHRSHNTNRLRNEIEVDCEWWDCSFVRLFIWSNCFVFRRCVFSDSQLIKTRFTVWCGCATPAPQTPHVHQAIPKQLSMVLLHSVSTVYQIALCALYAIAVEVEASIHWIFAVMTALDESSNASAAVCFYQLNSIFIRSERERER